MDLIYETRDGYITAGAISDKEWKGMCKVLGRLEWIDDDRFRTTADRFRNAELRKRLTADEIRKHGRDELLSRLDAEGVPAAPLLTRLELLGHEQIAANDTIGIYEFDDHGRIRLARPAARFSNTPAGIERAAPGLGEHSVQILRELGYTNEAIDELAAGGAVRVS
jgi:crotonobetainyl-CoA:carnitine CoA-transferase CaiB-like acyl-CoA transferase